MDAIPTKTTTSRSKRKEAEEAVDIIADEKPLHQILDEHQLTKIHKLFLAEETQIMVGEQLRAMLYDVARIKYESKAAFDLVFQRMNMKRNGMVSWDEFISHLILGFKDEETVTEFQALDPPIAKAARIIKSSHRHTVNTIVFCHQVKPDRSVNFLEGNYVTSSKDGILNYWSLDMQVERTVVSKCPDLKVADTYVTSVCCLPDVSVICTSSTERDVRFYDTSARKFELRVIITSFEYAVVTTTYVFSQDINVESKLLMGDMGGNIKILYFSSIGRGPFKSKPGVPLLALRYDHVFKGLEPGFRVIEFRHQHSDWVRQVTYYNSLNFIVSCSQCPRAAVVMRDVSETRGIYKYVIAKGAWCFAVGEGAQMIATGGMDCLIRIWNPWVTRRPNVIFAGHHAGVVGLVIQDSGKKLFSISKDKCCKVWDVQNQTCLQTYLGLPSELGGERSPMTLFYNIDSRQIIIGSVMMAVIELCPLQSGEHTDGYTHSAAISVVLYNPLFKTILTCGLDSYIINWDPWTGRRMSAIKEAHTRLQHSEIIPVEITAGTFDPGYQLLLTGANDGSLKVWNFNTGTCVRNMHITPGCEVTGVVWVKDRILAVGWNRFVTEFCDSGQAAGPGGAFSKSWQRRHSDDVLCTAARVPQTLATTTYSGEMILWRLETGQPYKMYNVANPTQRIKLLYDVDKKEEKDGRVMSGSTRKSGFSKVKSYKKLAANRLNRSKPPSPVSDHRKGYSVKSPELKIAETLSVRGLAVRCLLFLDARPMLPNVGTLFVSLESGKIQIWSHHPSGGFITSFQGIHNPGHYIVSMISDKKNEYLFTGGTAGYLKTYVIKNYICDDNSPLCMPLYRLQFPFMWNDVIVGRVKRAYKNQPLPILLNCYKAHRAIITALEYIDDTKIVITASGDFSVRLWTLGGRYLGTLGTFKKWNPINPIRPPSPTRDYRIPPDIKRVMSSTTYKVLVGNEYERKLSRKQIAARARQEIALKDYLKGIYGKRLEEPILGHYYKMPERLIYNHEFTLDTAFPYIPVYQHIIRPAPSATPVLTIPYKIEEEYGMKKSDISKKTPPKAK